MSSLVDSASATDESVPYRLVDRSAHVSLNVHIDTDTALWYRLYPDEDRITLHIGDGPAEVVLFLDRAGMCRLLDAVREAFLLLPRTCSGSLDGVGG